MVLVDAISRMIPGVLKTEESYKEESIYSGLLEYPQYTRPEKFKDSEVPDVLLSGNHKKIFEWRKEESLKITYNNRKDMFDDYVKNKENLSKEERKILDKYLEKL